MSNAIESYNTIHNNPFILSPLFEVFYRSIPRKPRNILLSYLILPLVLNPRSRAFLAKATAASSIRSMNKDRDRLYGLHERIQEYKQLTNECIQYAIDSHVIRIEADLIVVVAEATLDKTLCPEDSARATKGLVKLFLSYEVTSIYRLLGIKRL